MKTAKRQIAVIGLGYVGWPLFRLLCSKYKCWGIDIDICKIEKRRENNPNAYNITSSWNDVSGCNIFIVTVPTPIDINKNPDITSLENVCYEIAKVLKHGDIVVFESTVFPGATEDVCIPIIESDSGLKMNIDFTVGYSPERINIADSTHQLCNTPKIVSASDDKTLNLLAELYGSVIDAPIVKASSIKVAEAAKMYENVQRDVLIALANEYSEYCSKEGIDIHEVTACAATKWNFANVEPGLVGGHCIGVDPYYLLQRVSKLESSTPLIKCARLINESKAEKVVNRLITLIRAEHPCDDVNILLLGFAYKANTGDIRNTKVADIYKILKQRFQTIDCFDSHVDVEKVKSSYQIDLLTKMPDVKLYNYVIRMVNHKEFENMGNVLDIRQFL